MQLGNSKNWKGSKEGVTLHMFMGQTWNDPPLLNFTKGQWWLVTIDFKNKTSILGRGGSCLRVGDCAILIPTLIFVFYP